MTESVFYLHGLDIENGKEEEKELQALDCILVAKDLGKNSVINEELPCQREIQLKRQDFRK
jgi:hypothetical protein